MTSVWPVWSLRLAMMVVASMMMACAKTSPSGSFSPRAQEELVVPLTTVSDPTPARLRGMSNLFFEPLTAALRDSVRTSTTWTDVSSDLLVDARQVAPVRVLRYRVAGDTSWRFTVDSVGDLDFTRAPILSFARRGPLQVAALDLAVRTQAGIVRRVPYEVLRSDDGYTYGRIAEYRTGQIELNGQRFAVRVSNAGRSQPVFDFEGGANILVDLDGDGTLSDRATVSVGGRPASAEQVRGGTVFELNGGLYQLASLDAAGTELRLRPASRKGAVGINLKAPDVRARRLNGSEFRLSKQRGKVVLISFWATDCVPSASVRAPLNELVTKYGTSFVWAAVAKDTSRAEIDVYLKKSPMLGEVLQSDTATWRTYNPDVATPVFAIVDAKGVLRFRAVGALSIEAIRAKLDELLGSAR